MAEHKIVVLGEFGVGKSAVVIQFGEGFVFVFSLTSRLSFDKIAGYFQQVVGIKGADSFPKVLLGNKCDLNMEREISTEEGEEFGRELNCPYFETSGKARINVEESFFELVREMRKSTEHNVCVSK